MSAATSDSDDATPGARYRRGVAAGEWQDDPAQLARPEEGRALVSRRFRRRTLHRQ